MRRAVTQKRARLLLSRCERNLYINFGNKSPLGTSGKKHWLGFAHCPFGVTANNLGPSDEITRKRQRNTVLCACRKTFSIQFLCAETSATINTEPFSNKRGISFDYVSARFYMTFYGMRSLARLGFVCFVRARASGSRIALHDKACIRLTRRKTNCLPMHYRSVALCERACQ
jgi:hypothetical protein